SASGRRGKAAGSTEPFLPSVITETGLAIHRYICSGPPGSTGAAPHAARRNPFQPSLEALETRDCPSALPGPQDFGPLLDEIAHLHNESKGVKDSPAGKKEMLLQNALDQYEKLYGAPTKTNPLTLTAYELGLQQDFANGPTWLFLSPRAS